MTPHSSPLRQPTIHPINTQAGAYTKLRKRLVQLAGNSRSRINVRVAAVIFFACVGSPSVGRSVQPSRKGSLLSGAVYILTNQPTITLVTLTAVARTCNRSPCSTDIWCSLVGRAGGKRETNVSKSGETAPPKRRVREGKETYRAGPGNTASAILSPLLRLHPPA